LFGTGGVVLALSDPKLALPNGHQVRAVKDLLIVQGGQGVQVLQLCRALLGRGVMSTVLHLQCSAASAASGALSSTLRTRTTK